MPATVVTSKGFDVPLIEGIDYVSTYKQNTPPGVATVVVCGCGNFTGMSMGSFKIFPQILLTLLSNITKVSAACKGSYASGYKTVTLVLKVK